MRRTMVGLLLLCCAFCDPLWAQVNMAQTSPASSDPHFAETFQEATELMRRGEWSMAERLLIGLLDSGTQLGLVRHSLGITCQQQGRHSEAIEHFKKALEVDATLHNARALLGGSLIALGKIDEGLVELQRAASDLPKNVAIRLQLANGYANQGRLIEEIRVRQELAAIEPENPDLAFQLGQSYRELAEWSSAQLMEQGRRSPRLLQSIGQAQMLKGDLEGAVRSLQAAIALDETLLDLHLLMASVLYRQGKFEKALEAVEVELSLMPANIGAQQLKSEIQKRLAQ